MLSLKLMLIKKYFNVSIVNSKDTWRVALHPNLRNVHDAEVTTASHSERHLLFSFQLQRLSRSHQHKLSLSYKTSKILLGKTRKNLSNAPLPTNKPMPL